MATLSKPPVPIAATTAEPQTFQQLHLGVLVIQPSPFCNINCDYCYLPHRQQTRKMPHDVLRTVISKVWDSGLVGPPFTLLWHAGEPLAVPISWYREAFEIIDSFPQGRQLAEHNFQTNSTLITQQWCDFINERQIDIGVSLDGPQHIHDRHRKTRTGDGSWEKAMRGVELLRKNSIEHGAVAVISEYSLDYPREIYEFFRDLEIGGVGFNIEETEGINTASTLDSRSAENRVRIFLQTVYDLNKADGFPLSIREFDNARQNLETPELNQTPSGDFFNLETDPLAMVNIDSYGNFSTFSPELLGQVTEKYQTFNFGNLNTDALFDATGNPAFQKVLTDIESGNRKCADSCPYWSRCGGASPSNKYYENGTFDSAETRHCRCMIQMPMDIVRADRFAG